MGITSLDGKKEPDNFIIQQFIPWGFNTADILYGIYVEKQIFALHFVNYIVIFTYIKNVMIIILFEIKYGKNVICQIF